MDEVLIPDLPDENVAAVDNEAWQPGISRSELVRRQLTRETRRTAGPVTIDQLRLAGEVFKDLLDPDVMGKAWR